MVGLVHGLIEAGEVLFKSADAVEGLAQFLLDGEELFGQVVGAALGKEVCFFEAFDARVWLWAVGMRPGGWHGL